MHRIASNVEDAMAHAWHREDQELLQEHRIAALESNMSYGVLALGYGAPLFGMAEKDAEEVRARGLSFRSSTDSRDCVDSSHRNSADSSSIRRAGKARQFDLEMTPPVTPDCSEKENTTEQAQNQQPSNAGVLGVLRQRKPTVAQAPYLGKQRPF